MFDQDTLNSSLHKSILFRDIDTKEVDLIIEAGQFRFFEQGQYVYRQAENNRHFYIVASGKVELH